MRFRLLITLSLLITASLMVSPVSKGQTPQSRVPTPEGVLPVWPARIGKSTWALERFPDAYCVDLLDESRYQNLLANPGLLARPRSGGSLQQRRLRQIDQ